jgi:hypothetical protein
MSDEEIIEYALGFVEPTGRIDWEDLFFRLETAMGVDLPDSYLDPEIKRLKKIILQARKEANE